MHQLSEQMLQFISRNNSAVVGRTIHMSNDKQSSKPLFAVFYKLTKLF